MHAETAHGFACEGESLTAIAAIRPQSSKRGVLIIVGGPQYRAGSHRQFVLLARELARHDIPSLRFDVRGMGDSTGAPRGFEALAADIRAAIDQFFIIQPGLTEVVLWGLCDAASAALLYSGQDARVHGLVLLNPWVRTSQTAAQATLKHYYRSRFFDAGFWKKLIAGQFRPAAALRSFAGLALAAREPAASGLPSRMLQGLRSFSGPVLVILSGRDLTAREFNDACMRSDEWKRRTALRELPEANHTFARAEWRDRVAAWTVEWVKSW
jgi:exosortase A-associated hydrolase 1